MDTPETTDSKAPCICFIDYTGTWDPSSPYGWLELGQSVQVTANTFLPTLDVSIFTPNTTELH